MPTSLCPKFSALWVGQPNIHGKGLLNGLESCRIRNFRVSQWSVAWKSTTVPGFGLNVGSRCMGQYLQGDELLPEKLSDYLNQPSVCANLATYAALLRGCRNLNALSDGKWIHCLLAKSRHGESIYLRSLLVQMYGQCGALEDAYALFTRTCERNVYLWNAMIETNAQHGHWKLAIQLSEQMEFEGVIPDPVTFIATLSGCDCQRALAQGQRIHARVIGTEFVANVVLGTALISMYGKCDSVEDAQRVFYNMPTRDIVSCNAMIGVYTQHGLNKEALELFCSIQQKGLIPNRVSFLSILDACASHANLATGRQVHVNIRHAGLESDVIIATCLISMYGKCGSLQNARLMFETMPARSVVSINTMIAVYAQHEQGIESLKLFRQMQQEGMIPDNITFHTILSACTSWLTVAEARYVHICIICTGFELDLIVATAILSVYGKCGRLADAQNLFDQLPKRDVVSWNAMIAVYTQNGQGKKALEVLNQMQQAGMVPDMITFINCFSDCALSSLKDAQKLFESLPDSEVVVWNVMITAYAHHGFDKKALSLFKQMLWEGLIPDKATFLAILPACSNDGALIEGRQIHIHMIHNGYRSDVMLLTAAIHMYSKCGNLEAAYSVFEQMHERDVISWNAMISAYSQHGDGKRALQIFDQMHQNQVIPDKVTFVGIFEACASDAALAKGNHIHSYFMQSDLRADTVITTALVNMYHKCSSLQDAQSVFSKISEHDVVSWTAMIAACTEQGEVKEAFLLFAQMHRGGVVPDRAIYINLLTACIWQAALMEGRILHTRITLNNLEADVTVANALINMYGKCGSMEDAERVFNRISKRDVPSFNIIIAGYAQHGHGKQALQLLAKMQQGGLSPDQVTFASILCACSRTGLVNEGHLCLDYLLKYNHMTPTGEHYDCIVDSLGRAGRLDEAEDLINKMPVQPKYVSWMTVLGACKIQIDFERGEYISWYLSELNLENASPYIMLSNLFLQTVGQMMQNKL